MQLALEQLIYLHFSQIIKHHTEVLVWSKHLFEGSKPWFKFKGIV